MSRATPKKYAWIVVGAIVDYHGVIGGPVTQAGLMVRDAPFEIGGRGCRSGGWCAMLNGKTGWVACDALTPAREGGQDMRGMPRPGARRHAGAEGRRTTIPAMRPSAPALPPELRPGEPHEWTCSVFLGRACNCRFSATSPSGRGTDHE